jgi:hypothetical protein
MHLFCRFCKPVVCQAKDAWKKRFFLLSEKQVRYYSDEKQGKLCGTFDLARVREVRSSSGPNAGSPKEFPKVLFFQKKNNNNPFVLSLGVCVFD